MKVSYHSVHQPKCGVCQKHCKSFESLREHIFGEIIFHMHSDPETRVLHIFLDSSPKLLISYFLSHLGPMPKENCSRVFSEQGCDICLKVFDSPSSLSEHKKSCRISAPNPIVSLLVWTSSTHTKIKSLSSSGTSEVIVLWSIKDTYSRVNLPLF